MARETAVNVGTEFHREVQKLSPRFLAAGLALVLCHVLEIEPTEFSFAGTKFDFKHPVVIRGTLALVFLYYLWTIASATFQGHFLAPFRADRQVVRNLVRVARRPARGEKSGKPFLRNPKQIKRYVWWAMFSYNIFMTPFAIAILAIVGGGIWLSIPDCYNLAILVYERVFL